MAKKFDEPITVEGTATFNEQVVISSPEDSPQLSVASPTTLTNPIATLGTIEVRAPQVDAVAIGGNAGSVSTVDVTAFGRDALRNNTVGTNNVAIGPHTLRSNTTGFDNTALGSNTLYANTTGGANTALGIAALTLNTIGNNNSAVGSNAMFYNISGSENTAVGANALRDNSTGTTNTAVGVNALYVSSTGLRNTAVGKDALRFSIDGGDNTAVGVQTLYNSTTNYGNVAVGYQAGYATVGDNNVFIGMAAGYYSSVAGVGGSDNVGVGAFSHGADSPGSASGSGNSSLGTGSNWTAQTANYTTAIGWQATNYQDEGIAIGANAESNATVPRTVQIGDNTKSFSMSLGNNGRIIALNEFKSIVAGSADFAAFKTAIAALS